MFDKDFGYLQRDLERFHSVTNSGAVDGFFKVLSLKRQANRTADAADSVAKNAASYRKVIGETTSTVRAQLEAEVEAPASPRHRRDPRGTFPHRNTWPNACCPTTCSITLSVRNRT